MSIDGWKKRLADGVAKSGRSQREVSLSAKLNPGYLHSILKEGKDPTVGSLFAICEAAGINIHFVLGGFDITPKKQRYLELLSDADKKDQRLISHLLGLKQKLPKKPGPPFE